MTHDKPAVAPQLATRISPRVRTRLDDTLAAIKAQGESVTIRQALEEALTTWCDQAVERYHLSSLDDQ